jgi:hypothetical protein
MQETGTVQTSLDAAKVLYGSADTVTTSDGGEVAVKKVTLRTLPSLVEYLQTVIDSLVVTDTVTGESRMIDMHSPQAVLHLISKHLKPTYGVVLSLTSLKEDQLLDMPMDDVLLVVQRLWEVNATFFTQKIVPLLAKVESAASQ